MKHRVFRSVMRCFGQDLARAVARFAGRSVRHSGAQDLGGFVIRACFERGEKDLFESHPGGWGGEIS